MFYDDTMNLMLHVCDKEIGLVIVPDHPTDYCRVLDRKASLSVATTQHIETPRSRRGKACAPQQSVESTDTEAEDFPQSPSDSRLKRS